MQRPWRQRIGTSLRARREPCQTAFWPSGFALIVLVADRAPYVVPYTLWPATPRMGRKPRGRALVRHRSARPRQSGALIFGPPPDFLHRGCLVAFCFIPDGQGFAGVAAGFFSAAGPRRIVSRLATTIHGFPVVVLGHGHRRRARQYRLQATSSLPPRASVNFPALRTARARARRRPNVAREAGFVQAARLSGNGEFRPSCSHLCHNINADHDRADVRGPWATPSSTAASCLHSGWASARRRPSGASWCRKAQPSWSREWWIAFFPGGRRADGRRLLLQSHSCDVPCATNRRSALAHVWTHCHRPSRCSPFSI